MITIDVSPYAFDGIRWYEILSLTAVAAVIGWACLQVKRGLLPSYRVVAIAALVMVPAGALFARLFHVMDMWWYYRQFPERIIGFAGFSIYGAILGAILGLWLYCRVARLNFGHFADVLTPAIIVGQIIGRIGCFINGCCHGTITTLPWAVVYTDEASYASVGYSYHPWPIYEIAVLMLILGMVVRLKSRVKPSGSLFALYLAAYSAWRFAGGFLRPEAPFIIGLQQPQAVALVVLALTVPFLWCKTFRRKMPSG